MNNNPSLLFVDDEPAILNALKRVLRKEPFDILTAPNADAAMQILENEKVVLVVADLHMPGMNGIELLGIVAEKFPDIGRILMSGNADLPSLVAAVNKGQLTYYFEKPWSDDGLRLALRELVERFNLQKRNRSLLGTIRQQNDALIRQSKIQHRFFAMMSHEIRTPLNGVFGMLQLLQQKPLSEEERQLVETAMASSEHLVEIVNDVLDFSKIEAGEFQLSYDPFDLRRLCDDVIASLAPLANNKQLKLVADISAIPPGFHLLGDKLRLRQVLINLVGNAIKFTETGSVTLEVVSCKDGQQVIRITDTGIGIPESEIPTLFEAYQQVISQGTSREQGSGLGLSIAQQLVRLMSGDLTVESQLGEGTTFEINLGLPEAAASSSESEQLPAATHLAGRSFLVVDDNPTNRMIVRAMLEQLEASVVEMASGEETISYLRETPADFDVVFMDISMEGMDGIETLQHIRADALLEETVPVIAMSAHVQPEEQARFIASGMSGFLGKPFNREALLELIAEFGSEVIARPTESADSSDTEATIDVDAAVFGDLARSVGSAMPAMIESFRTDASSRSEKISEALAVKDWDKVAAEAHALGSSAGMFGATSLHAICRELESRFKAGERDDLQAAASTLLNQVTPSVAAVSRLADAETQT